MSLEREVYVVKKGEVRLKGVERAVKVKRLSSGEIAIDADGFLASYERRREESDDRKLALRENNRKRSAPINEEVPILPLQIKKQPNEKAVKAPGTDLTPEEKLRWNDFLDSLDKSAS